MVDLPPDMLRAILDEPGADDVRLIAADWLDDNGDADRAEFIRLQVGRAADNTPAVRMGLLLPCGCRFNMGHEYGCRWLRERELFAALTPSLEHGFPHGLIATIGYCPPDRGHAVFRRGFAAELYLSLEVFTAHAAALFRACPVEAVRLTDKRPVLNRPDGTAALYAVSDEPDTPFWRLPSWLAVYLPRRSGAGLLYVSEAEALEALSVACVCFGRDAARCTNTTSAVL